MKKAKEKHRKSKEKLQKKNTYDNICQEQQQTSDHQCHHLQQLFCFQTESFCEYNNKNSKLYDCGDIAYIIQKRCLVV